MFFSLLLFNVGESVLHVALDSSSCSSVRSSVAVDHRQGQVCHAFRDALLQSLFVMTGCLSSCFLLVPHFS